MKKPFLIAGLLLEGVCNPLAANAQDFMTFMSDVQFNLSIGMTVSGCKGNYYKEAILNFELGVDAQKPVYSFKADNTIYALTGIHWEQKGGQSNKSIINTDWNGNDDKSIKVKSIKLPVRAGYTHQFPKISLFIDFGPYFSLNVSSKEFKDVDYSTAEFGIGMTTGIKFDRFSMAIGADSDLTKLATYHYRGKDIELKNSAAHLNLRWCF